MDVYPSGYARWEVDAALAASGFTAGVIQSGALQKVTTTGHPSNPPGATVQPSVLVSTKAGSFFASSTKTLFADVTADPVALFRLSMTEQTATTSEQFEVLYSAGSIDCVYSDAAANAIYVSAAVSAGQHKVALWTDGATLSLIVDGAVVASDTGTTGAGVFDSCQVALAGYSGAVDDTTVNAVGVYEGITLSEATALTA
jgi:hypothetical protein